MPDLAVNIGKLSLKNPVMVASGTFGYAEEFNDFVSLAELGAIVSKTITLKPRCGNKPPRTCETPAGMLNSIGLENPGIDAFIKEKLPILAKIKAPVIVSISSEKDSGEFIALAKKLDRIKEVSAIELNISCPNIGSRLAVLGYRKQARTENRKPKTELISQEPKSTYAVVRSVRNVTDKTLITKLSPNVTDIAEIACAAEKAGSDAVSLTNTLSAMSIDIETRRPKIAAVTGGLSGPAIRPIAVRMVWEVYQQVKIPIIGMGGIMDAESALEFFIAGASAVSIGTASFINPKATIEIIAGIKSYLVSNRINNIKELVGSLRV